MLSKYEEIRMMGRAGGDEGGAEVRAPRFYWTAAHSRTLRELAAQGRTAPEIAEAIGCRVALVRTRAVREGVKVKRSIVGRIIWTAELDKTLRQRYPTDTAAAIARDIGATERAVYMRASTLGLRKSSEWIAENCRNNWRRGALERARKSHFKKGQAPHNKGVPASEWMPDPGLSPETQFKPGEMPYNWVPVGTYRITTQGDLEQKISDDRTPGMSRRNWRPVRVLVWEAEHGPVPEGHVVRFKAGFASTDPDAIKPEHLECITRAENMKRNSFWENLPPDAARLVQLRGVLNRRINSLTRDGK